MSKYEEIKAYLMAEAVKPQSRRKMPSVRELMRKFSASQSPVTRALNDLKEIGLLDSRHGVGTVSTGHLKEIIYPDPFADNEGESILYAVPDYYAENIWNQEHRVVAGAATRNIGVKVLHYQQDTDLPELLRTCLDKHVFRGLILSGTKTQESPELFEFVRSVKIPVVFINATFEPVPFPDHVTVLRTNTAQMGRIAVEYFARHEIKRVAMVRNEPAGEPSKILWKSLKDNASKAGIELHRFSADIRSWEDSMAAGARVTAAKLDEIRKNKIEVLLYTSVAGAMAGQSVLQKAGFRIPDDIGVMGGGDMRPAQYCFPSITVFLADYEQMCVDAIELVTGQKKGNEFLYDHKLIERDSVK